MLQIQNTEQKRFLQLRRDNQQTLFKFTHDKDVEEIAQLETDIKGQTAQTIKKIAAEKYQSVRVINADNERALAEKRSIAKAKQILADAEAYEI